MLLTRARALACEGDKTKQFERQSSVPRRRPQPCETRLRLARRDIKPSNPRSNIPTRRKRRSNHHPRAMIPSERPTPPSSTPPRVARPLENPKRFLTYRQVRTRRRGARLDLSRLRVERPRQFLPVARRRRSLRALELLNIDRLRVRQPARLEGHLRGHVTRLGAESRAVTGRGHAREARVLLGDLPQEIVGGLDVRDHRDERRRGVAGARPTARWVDRWGAVRSVD